MRLLSLFSGVGGFELGLEAAGFRPVCFVELDAWKRTVLAHHWPEVPCLADVRTFPATEWRGVDLVSGGFPCQDLSRASGPVLRRRGLRGERSGLFFQLARVVSESRPRAVLLENVPELLRYGRARDFAAVAATLAELGYGVAWRTLNPPHFGVPQRRRRVFVLAIAGDDPRAASRRAGAVLALGSRLPWPLGADGQATSDEPAPRSPAPCGLERLARALTTRQERQDASVETFVPVVAHALMAQKGAKGRGGTNVENTLVPTADGIRRLTPRECERLMGWPDDWTALGSDGKRYEATGDGVVAPVARWVGERLYAELSARS